MSAAFGVLGFISVYCGFGIYFEGDPFAWYHGALFATLGAMFTLIISK